MFSVDKYHPVQGVNKFQTVSFPITKAFAVDFGAQTTAANATATLVTFPAGSIMLGFSARITEAMETAGSGTVQLGFTGTALLSSAHASGTATIGTIICPPDSSGMALVLTADDTFDLILGTTGPSAGKVDIFVTYIPIPVGDIDTANFLSYVTT